MSLSNDGPVQFGAFRLGVGEMRKIICATALCAALVLNGGAAVPRPGHFDVASADIRGAGRKAPPESEADPFDHVMNVFEVHPKIEAAFGERYAGQWIDRSVSPPVLTVGVKLRTDADDRRAREIASSNQVVTVPRAMNARELAAAQDRAGAVFRSLSRPGLVASDAQSGQVIVALPEHDAIAEQRLRDAASPAPLVVWTDFKSSDTHTTRYANLPYEAALQISVAPANPAQNGAAQPAAVGPPIPVTEPMTCTSGFQLTRSVSPDPPIAYGTTAGHCGNVGWVAAIVRQKLGTVTLNPYLASATPATDALAFPLEASARAAYARMFRGMNEHRLISGSLTKSQMHKSDRLCFQGAVIQGNNCAYILLENIGQYVDTSNRYVQGMYCLEDAEPQQGDSGGPAYAVTGENPAIAAGLLKGTISAKYQNGDDVQLGCLSNIEDTLTALGAGFSVATS